MKAWEIILGVILGLFVNEATDISPWAAQKLVRWAAYRWSADPKLAAGYAEEWVALIEDRPGKLFKMFTALTFAGGAVGRVVTRQVRVASTRFGWSNAYFLRIVVTTDFGEVDVVTRLGRVAFILAQLHPRLLDYVVLRRLETWTRRQRTLHGYGCTAEVVLLDPSLKSRQRPRKVSAREP